VRVRAGVPAAELVVVARRATDGSVPALPDR